MNTLEDLFMVLERAKHAAVVAYVNDHGPGIDTMYYPPRRTGEVMLNSLTAAGYTLTPIRDTNWDIENCPDCSCGELHSPERSN
jgi:hypothetical protein